MISELIYVGLGDSRDLNTADNHRVILSHDITGHLMDVSYIAYCTLQLYMRENVKSRPWTARFQHR